jgi:SSS family solute:Na+ symporter
MSSLDSQFVCLGTMFTNDIAVRLIREERMTDRLKLLLSRGFIVMIVALTYVLSLFPPRNIFDLGVWCFSGFAGLFPLVLASLYWKRTTRPGAIACVLATAAVWAVLFYRNIVAGPGGEDELLIWGLMPVTFIVAASALTLVVVSLLTQPPSAERLARFFPDEDAASPGTRQRSGFEIAGKEG